MDSPEQPPDRFVQRAAVVALVVGANVGLVLVYLMLRSTDPDSGTRAAVLAPIVGGAWAALGVLASNRRSQPTNGQQPVPPALEQQGAPGPPPAQPAPPAGPNPVQPGP